MLLLSTVLTIMFILIGVAFLTLMEQKMLSYIQIRSLMQFLMCMHMNQIIMPPT